MRKIIAALSGVFLLCFAFSAQAQMNLLTGAGGKFRAAAAASYQGPGDVVTGGVLFYSCARAYNATYANGTNSLCDLVDSAAPSTVICTLRVLTTGFVDLAGTYCTGSVTPSAKCAAATGGVCNVSRMYNQIAPGTNDATSTTAATQPRLTFSALGGLPGITCTNAASSAITTTGTVTQNVPNTLVAVAVRTPSSATEGGIFGENGSGSVSLLYPATANTVGYRSGATTNTATASDTSFHSFAAVAPSGASSTIVVDGSGTTAAPNGANITVPMRLCRSANTTQSLNGTIMEAWLASIAFDSTQYGDVNSNARSSSGYGSF